jgi:prepilin-type N-terminal cleavage/methylation domain-containing protein
MVCKATYTRASQHSAFSITELLVALAIGGVILAGLCALWLFSGQIFAGIFNYVEMNNASKVALDRMTQEIRNVHRLKQFDPEKLTFEDFDGVDLKFEYKPGQGTLTRIKHGKKEVLVTGCDALQFSIFQHDPIAGSYDYYPTTDPDACKAVQVQWTTFRRLMGDRSNTESVRSARIVIRNH